MLVFVFRITNKMFKKKKNTKYQCLLSVLSIEYLMYKVTVMVS